MINSGQFKPSPSRRFITKPRPFRKPIVHAMTYHKVDRVWAVSCADLDAWPFPTAGMMQTADVPQLPITCKNCLNFEVKS